jgi:hypothetical protein
MPISSALSYVRGLLDGLGMPGPATSLVCSITPPDPFADPGIIPTCYLWPANGRESRDGPAGTASRNQGPNTSSGFKTLAHQMEIWLVWDGADNGSAPLFPAMIDAVNAALRTAYPMPADVTDPYTGATSQMSNIGEVLSWRVSVRPIPDSRNNRYEALLQVLITEVIQA